MRSRTGCLTCRKRKLKCDETKPVCGQCQKANRQCQASIGITFRHQHNASMNANGDHSRPGGNQPLSGFYAYKNTFDDKTIWVDIPKELTFYNTVNPYDHDPGAPELDRTRSSHGQTPFAHHQQEHWNVELDAQNQRSDFLSNGLEALSAAALYSPPKANMIPQPMSMHGHEAENSVGPVTPTRDLTAIGVHLPTPMSSSNNLNYILNPSSPTDSPIDPSLVSPPDQHQAPTSSLTSQNDAKETRQDGEIESEQKIVYLLRHFSESEGQWMVNQQAYTNEGS